VQGLLEHKHHDTLTTALITDTLLNNQQASSSTHSIETVDEAMTHVLGGMEQDGLELHHATQNGIQFKS
jgi:hypothetical protein